MTSSPSNPGAWVPPTAPTVSPLPPIGQPPSQPAGDSKETTSIGEPTAFFDNPVIDSLMTMCLELGAALWVVKDRLRVVEALLSEHGLATREQIDAYQTPPEEEAALKAARAEFIERIYGRLTAVKP
jgi:hypothetical protein